MLLNVLGLVSIKVLLLALELVVRNCWCCLVLREVLNDGRHPRCVGGDLALGFGMALVSEVLCYKQRCRNRGERPLNNE